MNKQKTEFIATAALIVVFISLIAGNLKKPAKKAHRAALPAQAPAQKEAPQSNQVPALKQQGQASQDMPDKKISELQKERSKLAWGRNPFSVPKASKEFQKTNLVLKGISLGKDKKAFAFINSEIVAQGDTIGNYEVVEIEKDKVMLKKDGQSFYITLPGE